MQIGNPLRGHPRFGSKVIGWMLLALLLCTAPVLAAEPRGPETQVVGGSAVPDNEYRFVVSVQNLLLPGSTTYDQHWCGGTLLDSRHVLTAAHCTFWFGSPLDPANLRVLYGQTVLSAQNGQLHQVAAIDVSPRYTEVEGEPVGYDVAVLTLSTPVRNAKVIQPVKKNNTGFQRPGDPVRVAGWGSTTQYFSGEAVAPHRPDRMRAARVNTIKTTKCVSQYAPGSFIGAATLCAEAPGKDACQGDSGGPLFAYNKKNKPVQVGIVSTGEGCADPKYAGVYAKMSDPIIANFITGILNR